MELSITLDNASIEDAIKDYVTKQGLDTVNKTISVKLIHGRKNNGSRAEVVIKDHTASNIEAEVTTVAAVSPSITIPTKPMDKPMVITIEAAEEQEPAVPSKIKFVDAKPASLPNTNSLF